MITWSSDRAGAAPSPAGTLGVGVGILGGATGGPAFVAIGRSKGAGVPEAFGHARGDERIAAVATAAAGDRGSEGLVDHLERRGRAVPGPVESSPLDRLDDERCWPSMI